MELLLYIAVLFTVLFLLRFVQLLILVRKNQKSSLAHRTNPARTMIVMGSGGHTAEMLRIVERLDCNRYTPRQYIIADTDKTSVVKVIESEVRREPDTAKQMYEITTIGRSREVHQTYISSVMTTISAVFNCVPIILKAKPDLILTNGPGTCVPICLVAFLARVLFLNTKCRIVFIESFCRVRSISLSGRILLFIVDIFVVQWPELIQQTTLWRNDVRCFGRL
ncbi:UDP-N-acetylglucosamine transferase subunit ALG14 homolog [Anopheles cruzii]|uniref:UDP-N-acetylglucosamine transferase subunit ALG14 homolog n=1 Tax=Anopheles cruzii TaxID=68878 RepID=UPI0022EC97DE|nr:UDP-N-acetylglucosamine transferase subunit ALG14 homolog [Anopheles cruzii]